MAVEKGLHDVLFFKVPERKIKDTKICEQIIPSNFADLSSVVTGFRRSTATSLWRNKKQLEEECGIKARFDALASQCTCSVARLVLYWLPSEVPFLRDCRGRKNCCKNIAFPFIGNASYFLFISLKRGETTDGVHTSYAAISFLKASSQSCISFKILR